MADDVGGIQAQVTADIQPFLSNLGKAEAAAKEFDARFGKINVVITATLRMPTQSAIRDYHRDLQREIDKQAPRVAPPPTAAAPAAGAAPAQIRRSVPAAVAAEAAAPAPVAVIAPPVVDAAAQARAAAAAAESKALAQAKATATGRTVPWTDVGNVQRTVRPERTTGGAVGERGETVLTGSRGAATPVSFGGPREFAGGRRTGGVGGPDDFQGIVEELGRVTAENERLQTGERRPRSAAQIAQLEAARSRTVKNPATGLFERAEEGPLIITRASQRAAQAATTGTAPPIRRAPQVAAAAEPEEIEQFVASFPSDVPLTGEQKYLMEASQGKYGPEEQAAALAQLPQTPDRKGKGRAAKARKPLITAAERASLIQPGETEPVVEPQAVFEESAASRLISAEQLISARQQTTVRAMGTFFTGLLSVFGGGAGARELIQEADRALARQLTLEKRLGDQRNEEERLEGLRRKSRGERRKEFDTELRNLRPQIQESAEAVAVATEATEEATAAAAAAAQPLRNVAAGFVGGIGASLVFTVGMTAVTTALEAVVKATREGVGSLTGWREITNETSKAIAEQTTQLHGLVEVAVANTFAQTALSGGVADTIRPLLEQRAALQAGSQAFSSQIDLIHVWQNLRQREIEGGPIPGISTGIGGVAGTQIFAQPGIIQQLARLTSGGQAGERAIGGAAIGGAIGAGLGGAIGLLGGGIGVIPGVAVGGAAGAAIGGAIGQFPQAQVKPPGLFTTPFEAAQIAEKNQQITASATVQLEAFGLAVDDLNDAAKRGTIGANQLGEAISGSTDQAAIQRTADVLAGLQVPPDQIENLKAAGFALQGIANLSLEDAIQEGKDYFEAVARGATVPVAEEVLAYMRTNVIPARLFQLTRQSELQRGLIEVQAGVQRAAQPFLPLGVSVPPAGAPGTGVPGGLGAVSPELQGALGTAQGIDRLNVQRIEAARVDIGNLALPGQRAGALASFDRLQGLGQQAAGIQTFITQSQLTLATAQYSEQLRQARLSLGDLAVLSGRVASSGGDNLGALQKQTIQYERQNSLLQIQLSTLQLELQQRQINFQVAIAGFTAPGVTGAERAARIEQAQLEASFAQRQLDLQKEMLSNQAKSVPLQIAIQDIQFSRDYQTALNAINLLTQGRQVTIDVAAAQEALQRINAEIELEQANLQTFIQAGASAAAALIADQAKHIETYTTATQDLQESADEFFAGISDSYATGLITFLTRTTNFVNGMFRQRPASTGGTYHPPIPQQTGFYGQVTSATPMVVGEAGAETVAILRNPREMLWGGGGGGGTSINLTITVTGNNVRSDADLETLSTVVARKVEEAISRRTSLLGFRPS